MVNHLTWGLQLIHRTLFLTRSFPTAYYFTKSNIICSQKQFLLLTSLFEYNCIRFLCLYFAPLMTRDF